jgi:hypothetical protein
LNTNKAEELVKIRTKYTTPAAPQKAATLDRDFRSHDEYDPEPEPEPEPDPEPEDLDYDYGVGGQDPYDYPDSPLAFPSSPAHPYTNRDNNANEAPPSIAGSKRARSDSIEPETPQLRKPKKNEGAEGRPKAHHFEIEVQEVLFAAIRHYRFLLSSEHAYPDLVTEITWAKAAWKEGCRVHEADIAHTPELLKLVSRDSGLCYAMNCPNIFVDHCSWKPLTRRGEIQGTGYCLQCV